MRPAQGTYPKFLETYISKVTEDNAYEALHNNTKILFQILDSIPEEKGDFAYAEGKWTIKQLLIHISDAERIFAYRALRFARGDEQQPLPFEEDDYAANCNAEKRTLKSVTDELKSVRHATITLVDSFRNEELSKPGHTASGKTTVNAIIYAICGHSAHHVNVAKERYLI